MAKRRRKGRKGKRKLKMTKKAIASRRAHRRAKAKKEHKAVARRRSKPRRAARRASAHRPKRRKARRGKSRSRSVKIVRHPAIVTERRGRRRRYGRRRHHHLMENPLTGVEMFAGGLTMLLGAGVADVVDRYVATQPLGTDANGNFFETNSDGKSPATDPNFIMDSTTNKPIALHNGASVEAPMGLKRWGVGAVVVVVPFVAAAFTKRSPTLRSALQLFGFGAAARLLGKGMKDLVVRFAGKTKAVNRLYSLELAGYNGAANLQGQTTGQAPTLPTFPNAPPPGLGRHADLYHTRHGGGDGYGNGDGRGGLAGCSCGGTCGKCRGGQPVVAPAASAAASVPQGPPPPAPPPQYAPPAQVAPPQGQVAPPAPPAPPQGQPAQLPQPGTALAGTPWTPGAKDYVRGRHPHERGPWAAGVSGPPQQERFNPYRNANTRNLQ